MTHPKAIDVNCIMREIRERAKRRQVSPNVSDLHIHNLAAVSILADARAGLAEVQTSGAHIDDLPPQPPTIRGAVGAALSRFVKRILFWQYTQARGVHASLIRAIEPLISSIEHVLAMSSRIEHMDASTRTASAKLQRLDDRTDRLDAAVHTATEHRERVEAALSGTAAEIHVLQHQIASLLQSLNETTQGMACVRDEVQSAHAATNGLIDEQHKLREQIVVLERQATLTRRYVVLQEHRIASFQNALNGGAQIPQPNSSSEIPDPAFESMGDMYLAFEDAFRGPQKAVADRMRAYLPILETTQVARDSDTVVDIGCGRGEWLELLSQSGYLAIGCDSNDLMVSVCRERGLNAVKQDGLQYLESLADDSIALITAFHVIEHLPLPKMLALIDGSLRALRPGGTLILETPNPANMLVASHNFYLDPTHHKPVPPQLLQFIVQARGFSDVRPLMLHPYPDSMLLDDGTEVAKRFNEYFYGPQDYAIVARRP